MGFTTKASYEDCKKRGFYSKREFLFHKAAGFETKESLDQLICQTLQFDLSAPEGLSVIAAGTLKTRRGTSADRDRLKPALGASL